MDKHLQVSIISPEKVLFEGQVDSIVLPGKSSYFTVLPEHVNIISELEPGLLTVKVDEKETSYIINGGFVEVSDNIVSTLVEGVLLPTEVDVKTEKENLGNMIQKIIQPEERDFKENDIKSARARIQYTIKK